MITKISVINNNGEQLDLELAKPELSGFQVMGVDGLGPVQASINSTDFGSGDGAFYNSSRVGTRNIVLTLGFLANSSIETTRQLTYKYFPVKKLIKLIVYTDNKTVSTYGYVENNQPDIFSPAEKTQISILCMNPYFENAVAQSTNMWPKYLMPNPSLLADGGQWGVSGNGTSGARLATGGYSGLGFYRLSAASSNSNNAVSPYPNYGNYGNAEVQKVSGVDPQTQYTIYFWVRTNVPLTLHIGVNFYNSEGSYLSTSVSGDTGTAANAWYRPTHTFTTPAGAAYIYASVIVSSTMAAGNTLDVDACQITQTSSAQLFKEFQGETPGVMRRNMCLNPSFNTDANNWTVWGGVGGAASIGRIPSGGSDGGAYGRLSVTTIPSSGGGFATSMIEIGANDTITMSAWLRPNIPLNIRQQYQFYNNGVATTGGNDTNLIALPAYVWTRVSLTFTNPQASNNQVQCRFYVEGAGFNAITNTLELDQCVVERSSTLGDYFENAELLVNYAGEVETPAKFKLFFLDTATKVKITRMSDGKYFYIDTTNIQAITNMLTTFDSRDYVVIDSTVGAKSVKLYRAGGFAGTFNLMNLVERNSSWLTLFPGANKFRLEAETGLESIRLAVDNPILYQGV